MVDLGDGAIIPGLVNAHTHLEFSDLGHPLGRPGINFTDWIRLIVTQRNESNQESNSKGLTTKKTAAIESGIDESFASGVWAIGEIATLPCQPYAYQNRRRHMALTCFLEQLGRDESTLDQKRNELTDFFAKKSDRKLCDVQFGSSPHAPYSVSPSLLQQICQQSASAGRPIAMHLAETMIERELLEHRTGDFVSLLKDFGVWESASFENRMSIRKTLEVLASAPTSLIVHGNYLNDSELDFVAANAERMSIAFCPRTHHFFGHSAYPLEKMLKRRINVCLGTDSRASNPDLDLLSEAKHIANSFSRLDSRLILEMATLNGAIALGIAQKYGTLTAGKKPALSFIAHPDANSNQSPFEWMFDIESKCSSLIVG